MGAGLRDISDKEIKTALINLASDGAENEVAIAAVTGKKLEIVDMFLVVSAATSIGFETAVPTESGTALTGLMSLAVKSVYAPGYNPDSHFATLAGQNLEIACGGATDIDGWINYYEV